MNIVERHIELGRGEIRFERIISFDHGKDARESLIKAINFLHNSSDSLVLGGKIPERISIEYDSESWKIKMVSYVNSRKSAIQTDE